jgi:hypothetical protein
LTREVADCVVGGRGGLVEDFGDVAQRAVDDPRRATQRSAHDRLERQLDERALETLAGGVGSVDAADLPLDRPLPGMFPSLKARSIGVPLL